MTDDEFDLRLRQAVRPLVTEIVTTSVARGADPATWRRQRSRVSWLLAPSVVAVMAIGSAFALPRMAGLLGPGAVTTASDAKIATADGDVFARTSADEAHLEIVLEKDATTSVVLVSIAEPVPQNMSFISMHVVDCPPSTGLAQQYYVLGQSTFGEMITLHGIDGTAAEVVGGRYLIAITATSIPSGRWTLGFGDGPDGFVVGGSSFLTVSAWGEKSPAGCYFDGQ